MNNLQLFYRNAKRRVTYELLKKFIQNGQHADDTALGPGGFEAAWRHVLGGINPALETIPSQEVLQRLDAEFQTAEQALADFRPAAWSRLLFQARSGQFPASMRRAASQLAFETFPNIKSQATEVELFVGRATDRTPQQYETNVIRAWNEMELRGTIHFLYNKVMELADLWQNRAPNLGRPPLDQLLLNL